MSDPYIPHLGPPPSCPLSLNPVGFKSLGFWASFFVLNPRLLNPKRATFLEVFSSTPCWRLASSMCAMAFSNIGIRSASSWRRRRFRGLNAQGPNRKSSSLNIPDPTNLHPQHHKHSMPIKFFYILHVLTYAQNPILIINFTRRFYSYNASVSR